MAALGKILGGLGSMVGVGGGSAGLGSILAAGQMQMAQSVLLQLSNTYMNMMTAQITTMANQQKTLMDAAAGIGTAYANGSASLYGALYSANNEMGSIFKKAGGH